VLWKASETPTVSQTINGRIQGDVEVSGGLYGNLSEARRKQLAILVRD
jgi:hypothetical protein